MNQIKQGYKQTKVGIIPEDWEVVKVGEKFDFLKTYSNSREDLNNVDEISYIHYGEIHTKHKFYIDFGKFELPKINKSKLPNEIIFAQNGDLVIADASEDYADIGKSAEIKNLTSKAVSGLHTFLLRDKNNNFVDGYKGYLLYNEIVARSIKKIATGISVLGISKTNLSKLEIPLPPLKEQEKIAEILTTWDEAITKQTELLEAKELQKKALMQKLLSGEIRFQGFNEDWKFVKLGDLLDYLQPTQYLVSDTNYSDEYATPVLTAGKTFILGYTNETEGIFEDNLPVIIFDDFTTATQFVDFPFKAKSSAMKILKPKDKSVNVKLIYEIMQMINFVADDHKRYWISEYQELEIKLPSKEEQLKISEFLNTINDEINLLKNELEELKLQKKALMQKLLTGEVRVKV